MTKLTAFRANKTSLGTSVVCLHKSAPYVPALYKYKLYKRVVAVYRKQGSLMGSLDPHLI